MKQKNKAQAEEEKRYGRKYLNGDFTQWEFDKFKEVKTNLLTAQQTNEATKKRIPQFERERGEAQMRRVIQAIKEAVNNGRFETDKLYNLHPWNTELLIEKGYTITEGKRHTHTGEDETYNIISWG